MAMVGSLITRLGGFIAVAGLISLGLALFLPSYELRILKWVEMWGLAFLIGNLEFRILEEDKRLKPRLIIPWCNLQSLSE